MGEIVWNTGDPQVNPLVRPGVYQLRGTFWIDGEHFELVGIHRADSEPTVTASVAWAESVVSVELLADGVPTGIKESRLVRG